MLGRSGLHASKIGFGSYRCRENDDTHLSALTEALETGCNLIDTASNYDDGGAERLVGQVVGEKISGGQLRRAELILISKAGYLQGENLLMAKKRESRGEPFPETVKFEEDLWHCIHPEFLEQQVAQSLERLQVETIDIFLLHNPEYYLIDALKRGTPDGRTAFSEFYRRLKKAFAALEALADSGKISYYGLSSNTLPGDPGRRDFVSLAFVWEAYQEACRTLGKNEVQGRFAVIQFPFNWIETEALLLKNNRFEGENYSVLELAEKFNLGVMVNRPLNAIRPGNLYRLAKYSFREGQNYERKLDSEVKALGDLEAALTEYIKSGKMADETGAGRKLTDMFKLSGKLQEASQKLGDEAALDGILMQYFVPLMHRAGADFLQNLPRPQAEKGRAVLQAVFNQFNRTVRVLREKLHADAFAAVKPLEVVFDAAYPALSHLTFSQKALLTAAAAPGVNTVLNGMRRPDYVENSMAVLRWELPDVRPLLRQKFIPGSPRR